MADEKDRKKRKPTAAEQAWQKRRAESTAAYNQRKAEREERRAANTDDPERAAAARRAAEMYRARIPVPDNGAAAPAAGGKPGGGNAVPAAGGKPGGGNGVPAVGGELADNVALQALTAEVANLRNELYRMHGELADLKKRQTYTIKFGEDEVEGGGSDSVEVVVGDVYDIETHTYKQYKRTISGIKLEPATKAQEAGETIFVTTPISSELLN